MMKYPLKSAYLLGTLALAGVSTFCFCSVVNGVSIDTSAKSFEHRSSLYSLFLGDENNNAKIQAVGENYLGVSTGMIVGSDTSKSSSALSVIGGGGLNSISAGRSGIGGGEGNSISADSSVIGGGYGNTVRDGKESSTVVGGSGNSVDFGGVVVGGVNNGALSNGSVVIGGSNNYAVGENSMAMGSNAEASVGSFAWNSNVDKNAAGIDAKNGVLIGAYEPISGVNLLVGGAVKIGSNNGFDIKFEVGEIREKDGCFYTYDGNYWHVLNKNKGETCLPETCSFGSTLLQLGDSVIAYKSAYSQNCEGEAVKVTCNIGGVLGEEGETYYPYCYYGEVPHPGTCGSSEPSGDGVILGESTYLDPIQKEWTYTTDDYLGVCEWTCAEGYQKDENINTCVEKSKKCSGSIPMYASANNSHVSQNGIPWHYNGGNMMDSCSFSCNVGYNWNGSACVWGGAETRECNMEKFIDVGRDEIEISNGVDKIIIMDRDLGAHEAGTDRDNIDTKGCYYQWGNNAGFAIVGDVERGDVVDASEYGHQGRFSRNAFVFGDFWDISHNQALWGGANDFGKDDVSNGWDAGNDRTERQGPCPDGWHVPSEGEWGRLIQLFAEDVGLGSEEENGLFVLEGVSDKFLEKFVMSSAGFRSNTDGSIVDDKSVHYRSSSAYDDKARSFVVDDEGYVRTKKTSKETTNGLPIRCFKDMDMGINAGGMGNAGGCSAQNVQGYRVPALENGATTGAVISGSIMNGSTTCTRNVKCVNGRVIFDLESEEYCNTNCNAGYERSDDSAGCVSQSQCDLGSFRWEEVKILNPNNSNEAIIIMDRNLGAKRADGDLNDENDRGCYFQWGNNHGFHSKDRITPVREAVDASGFGPGNWYDSDVFIAVDPSWDISNNTKLWGGSDSSSLNQGPCPDGWHVPTGLEWDTLIKYLRAGSSPYLGITNTNIQNLFPLVGMLEYNTASIRNVGQGGYYWASTLSGGSRQAEYLYVSQGGVDKVKRERTSFAFPIRCFKNTDNKCSGGNINGYDIPPMLHGGTGEVSTNVVVGGDIVGTKYRVATCNDGNFSLSPTGRIECMSSYIPTSDGESCEHIDECNPTAAELTECREMGGTFDYGNCDCVPPSTPYLYAACVGFPEPSGTGVIYQLPLEGASGNIPWHRVSTQHPGSGTLYFRPLGSCEWTCRPGYYSPSSVGLHTSCVSCPNGYTNSLTGSSNQSDCRMNVPAGYYVPYGGASAEQCDKGTYSVAHKVNKGSTSDCLECPDPKPANSEWTDYDRNKCRSQCKAGYYRVNGVSFGNGYVNVDECQATQAFNGGTCSSSSSLSFASQDYQCKKCPNGKTSDAGATSENECYREPQCGSASGGLYGMPPQDNLCEKGTAECVVGLKNLLSFDTNNDACLMYNAVDPLYWFWNCRNGNSVTSCGARVAKSCPGPCGSAQHGDTLTCYKSSSATCPDECTSQIRTCYNGERFANTKRGLSQMIAVDFDASFTSQTCSQHNQSTSGLYENQSDCEVDHRLCDAVSVSYYSSGETLPNGKTFRAGCKTKTMYKWNTRCKTGYTYATGPKVCTATPECDYSEQYAKCSVGTVYYPSSFTDPAYRKNNWYCINPNYGYSSCRPNITACQASKYCQRR